MSKRAFDMDAFKAWLVERGAIVDAATNPYEILRTRTCEGIFVAYKNTKGTERWPDGLIAIREAFLAGKDIALSPDLKSRVRLRHTIESIAARDGLECWFCERGFLSTDSREITVEHLCPKAHGGPDHLSNLVIACEPCNRAAGNQSIADKVRLRERMRAPGSEAA